MLIAKEVADEDRSERDALAGCLPRSSEFRGLKNNKAVDKMMDPMVRSLRRLAAASDAAKLFGSWTSRLMATSTRVSPLKPESFHWYNYTAASAYFMLSVSAV